MLYPLKFQHIYKDKIWGGNKFRTILGRKDVKSETCGESWEISAVQDNVSVVSNGYLKGNDLQELIEVYMDEIVGQKVYEKFGIEFPLLVKFLDTNDLLSVQVHPDDAVAKERHKAYGKTEMWYVMDADEGGNLIIGFEKDSSKQEFSKAIEEGKVPQLLHSEIAKKGDVFFLPAGRVHSIGKGLLVAEIQQTSDITYRIFDWNRVDADGNSRELHLGLAMDVIDYTAQDDYKTHYTEKQNATNELVSCQYFQTNLLRFNQVVEKDYYSLDSFVIYMCMEGSASIDFGGSYEEQITKGETVLIPAALHSVKLTPRGEASLLEVYIP
ncbi:MAG: class I mannose-6-phosphate isomerase [Bacteroidales bacterium]|nr:class I mannose-6-phosphate isomerase [Bacteroidales bacterium]